MRTIKMTTNYIPTVKGDALDGTMQRTGEGMTSPERKWSGKKSGD